ncbi:probable N-acetyltransferase CML1, partial [Scyliorhinus torazame]|uniref:probable N-acetyltransferase CML1 n=1 Tax=Scyliorhinus torazame TaxID=75743 RepID=UPI003B59ED90
MARIPGFIIRGYRPGDLREVWRIFAEGLVAMAGPAFKRAALAPSNVTLLLAALGAGYALTGSLPCAGLASLALLGLVYLSSRVIFTRYVQENLRGDMADIEGCYLRAPGCGFWVAEEEGEGPLAGMVAAKATPPLPCQLLRLSVDPPFRRRGLAQELTEAVLDSARGQGCPQPTLCTCTRGWASGWQGPAWAPPDPPVPDHHLRAGEDALSASPLGYRGGGL